VRAPTVVPISPVPAAAPIDAPATDVHRAALLFETSLSRPSRSETTGVHLRGSGLLAGVDRQRVDLLP
jgi:hypothetical protein